MYIVIDIRWQSRHSQQSFCVISYRAWASYTLIVAKYTQSCVMSAWV